MKVEVKNGKQYVNTVIPGVIVILFTTRNTKEYKTEKKIYIYNNETLMLDTAIDVPIIKMNFLCY